MRVDEIGSPQVGHLVDRERGEAVGLPHLPQQRQVALAAVAEREARADVDLARLERAPQEVAHEGARRHLGELGREAHHHHVVDRGLVEQRLLLRLRGEEA